MANLLKDFFAKLIKAGSVEIEASGGRKFRAGAGPGSKVGLG
jgi:hypothetical protein